MVSTCNTIYGLLLQVGRWCGSCWVQLPLCRAAGPHPLGLHCLAVLHCWLLALTSACCASPSAVPPLASLQHQKDCKFREQLKQGALHCAPACLFDKGVPLYGCAALLCGLWPWPLLLVERCWQSTP